jgi:hypothetical protein
MANEIVQSYILVGFLRGFVFLFMNLCLKGKRIKFRIGISFCLASRLLLGTSQKVEFETKMNL